MVGLNALIRARLQLAQIKVLHLLRHASRACPARASGSIRQYDIPGAARSPRLPRSHRRRMGLGREP